MVDTKNFGGEDTTEGGGWKNPIIICWWFLKCNRFSVFVRHNHLWFNSRPKQPLGTSSTESRHKSQVGRRCWEDDRERNIRWLIVFFFGQLFYYNNKNTRVGCLDCSLVNPLFRKILCWSLDPRTAQSTNWSATRLYGQWPLDHSIEHCNRYDWRDSYI